MSVPRRPASLVTSLYLFGGAAAFWLAAALATLFAIPQYSRYYGDLNQDVDAGSIATALLVLAAVMAAVGAALVVLLLWLDAYGWSAARVLTYVYSGLSLVVALVLLLSNPFSGIAWHDRLMIAITVLTMLLLLGAIVLLMRPASAQFFRDYRSVRREAANQRREARLRQAQRFGLPPPPPPASGPPQH